MAVNVKRPRSAIASRGRSPTHRLTDSPTHSVPPVPPVVVQRLPDRDDAVVPGAAVRVAHTQRGRVPVARRRLLDHVDVAASFDPLDPQDAILARHGGEELAVVVANLAVADRLDVGPA